MDEHHEYLYTLALLHGLDCYKGYDRGWFVKNYPEFQRDWVIHTGNYSWPLLEELVDYYCKYYKYPV